MACKGSGVQILSAPPQVRGPIWPSPALSLAAPTATNTPLPRPAPAPSPNNPARPLGLLPLGGQHRDALATFADNSRHASPWAATLYWQARGRGKRHPQAARILMRAWLRVMWACWHANTPYQINHHGAEQRLNDQSTARG